MNRTPLQVALAALFWTVLTACGGSTPSAGGGTPPPPPPPVDTTYSIEVSARDTTLPGRDSDGNGVRDDLDGYITQAVDPAAQVEARAYSRLTQRLVTTSDPSTLSALLVAQDMALTCLASKLPDRWAAVAGSLDDRTLNNEARTLAYWATMRQAAGLQVPLTLECDPAQMTPAALTLRPMDVANTASSWSRSTPHGCAYRIVFINGIQNDRIEARLNLLAIMKAMGPVYEEFGTDKPGHAVQYGYIYNPTVSLTADLTEALRQKLSELNSPGWWLVNAALRVILGGGASQSVEVTNLVKQLAVTVTDLVAQELVNEVQRKSATTYEDDIVRQAAQLIGDAAKVQPVVIVAHSQGNLIANAAWWKIKRDRPDVDVVKNVHIVSVGTPASGVANGVYVTREADRVMAAVRVLQPGTLPANNATSGDLLSLNHNFESAYMSGLGNLVPNLVESQLDASAPGEVCIELKPNSATVKASSQLQLEWTEYGFESNAIIEPRWTLRNLSGGETGALDKSGMYSAPSSTGKVLVALTPNVLFLGRVYSSDRKYATSTIEVTGLPEIYNISYDATDSTTINIKDFSGDYSAYYSDKEAIWKISSSSHWDCKFTVGGDFVRCAVQSNGSDSIVGRNVEVINYLTPCAGVRRVEFERSVTGGSAGWFTAALSMDGLMSFNVDDSSFPSVSGTDTTVTSEETSCWSYSGPPDVQPAESSFFHNIPIEYYIANLAVNESRNIKTTSANCREVPEAISSCSSNIEINILITRVQ